MIEINRMCYIGLVGKNFYCIFYFFICKYLYILCILDCIEGKSS